MWGKKNILHSLRRGETKSLHRGKSVSEEVYSLQVHFLPPSKEYSVYEFLVNKQALFQQMSEFRDFMMHIVKQLRRKRIGSWQLTLFLSWDSEWHAGSAVGSLSHNRLRCGEGFRSQSVPYIVKLVCDSFQLHLQHCLDMVEVLCGSLLTQEFNDARDAQGFALRTAKTRDVPQPPKKSSMPNTRKIFLTARPGKCMGSCCSTLYQQQRSETSVLYSAPGTTLSFCH